MACDWWNVWCDATSFLNSTHFRGQAQSITHPGMCDALRGKTRERPVAQGRQGRQEEKRLGRKSRGEQSRNKEQRGFLSLMHAMERVTRRERTA